jgi:hypothetical protein
MVCFGSDNIQVRMDEVNLNGNSQQFAVDVYWFHLATPSVVLALLRRIAGLLLNNWKRRAMSQPLFNFSSSPCIYSIRISNRWLLSPLTKLLR